MMDGPMNIKFTYCCLAYYPYFVKSLSVWEHMILNLNMFILRNG